MTYRGRVAGGVVVVNKPEALPEGTVVSVHVVARVRRAGKKARGTAPDIWSRLLRLAGTAKGLPVDLARNHDHYAHGAPRK
jgi:hypothetical protein